MRRPLNPRQVRAARALLELSQEDLAHSADIGVATLKRFESGQPTRIETERSLRSALERHGVVIIDEGTVIDGYRLAGGIAVRADVSAFKPNDTPETDSGRMRKRVRSV